MLMKVTLKRVVIACTAFMLYGALALIPQATYAQGEQYVLNFNPDSVENIKKALEDNDHSQETAVNQTILHGRGGIYGNREVQFKLDNSAPSGLAANNMYIYKSRTFTCGDYQIDAALQVGLPNDIANDDARARIGYTRVTGGNLGSGVAPPSGQYFVSQSDVNRMTANCRPGNYNRESGITAQNFQKNKQRLITQGWPANLATVSSDVGAGGGGGGGDTDPETCNSEGGALAWFLCPVIDIINTTVGKLMQDFILNQLQYEPLSVNPDEQNSVANNLFAVWNAIRTLANILFVVIFLFIVFANTISMNVNAYTVKKMLPRLVAAVLLVQLSFLICAIAIDMGNIAGQGIGTLISQALPESARQGRGGDLGIGWEILTGALLAMLAVPIIKSIGIATILLLAIGAVFAVLSVVVTLILRDLIISVLVITSPLAFAAWVLPGTEKVFQTWYRLFIRIILMYPLIALLFSVGSLLSASVSGTGDDTGVQAVMAGIFPIVAFFMVPWTFKWAGGAMAMTAGYVGRLSNRAGNATSGAYKNSRGYKASQQRRELKAAERFGGRLGSNNPVKKAFGNWQATGTILGGRANRKGGYGNVDPVVQRQIDLANHKARQDAQKGLEGLTSDDLKKMLVTDSSGRLKNRTQGMAAMGELAKRGELSADHLKTAHRTFNDGTAEGKRQGQLAFRYAQSQIADRKVNPLVSNVGMDDFNSAGNMELTHTTVNRIASASPEAFTSMSGKGMEALSHAAVKDANGNVVAGRSVMDELADRGTLHKVLHGPNAKKLQQKMKTDALDELRSYEKFYVANKGGPLPQVP